MSNAEPTLEQRLREAYQAAADAWAPSVAPPLPRAGRRRWRRLFAPVAAAVCVAALVVAAVAVDRIGRPARPAGTPSPPVSTGGSDRSGGPPRVVVEVPLNPSGSLRVRDTATGAEVAELPPPRGRAFGRVAVAADDRTFIVSIGDLADQQVRFHRLRLSPTGRIIQFAPLPGITVPTVRGTSGDLAVSPDGSKIAYVAYRRGDLPGLRAARGAPDAIGRIEVISMATGQRRIWASPYMSRIESLSWAGSTLAFIFTRNYRPPPGSQADVIARDQQVRLLDTAAGGDQLLAGRTVLDTGPNAVGSAWLRPDGRSLTAATGGGSGLRVYSVRTGRQLRELIEPEPREGSKWRPLTADATGRHLLAVDDDSMALMRIDPAGRITALPGQPGELVDAAW